MAAYSQSMEQWSLWEHPRCIWETLVTLHEVFVTNLDVVLETAVKAPLPLAMTRFPCFVRCIQTADLRRRSFSARDTLFLWMTATSTSTVSSSGTAASQVYLDFVLPIAILCGAHDRLN